MNGLGKSFIAFGVFLGFATCMAGLAGTSLAFPGTLLDGMWRLNPLAYRQLSPLGRWMGLAFLLFAGLLMVTAIGWFRRRRWSWRLSLAIIATQIAGDIGNIVTGRVMEGVFGVTVASLLLLWLCSSPVKAAFPQRDRSFGHTAI